MTTDESELKALMLASLEGDAAAHRVLLDRLSSRLRAYYKSKLARIGRVAAEAEDLVQEAVLAIHLKRSTYDPGEPLTPWVYAIARYKLVDFLRRTRASRADVPIDEADEVMAHDDHDAAESSYDIRRLMERLSKNMRCAVEAVKLDGLNTAEAAKRCGLSESGVKVNVHRGLRTLAAFDREGKRAVKTEDLVAFLSTNVEPVDRGAVVRTLYLAVGCGVMVALDIAFFGLGFRPDFATTRALIFLAVKLVFAIGIVGLAIVYLTRLTRPGGERKTSPFLVLVPFLVIVFLAAISLGSAPRAHWDRMIVGDDWLECLLSIPVIAVVPFAVSIWAVRKGAPTNLVRAGAFAGLVAGGVSAIGYALHCTDDSLPFIAVWYGGTIVLCTLAGAALGPRLLRW